MIFSFVVESERFPSKLMMKFLETKLCKFDPVVVYSDFESCDEHKYEEIIGALKFQVNFLKDNKNKLIIVEDNPVLSLFSLKSILNDQKLCQDISAFVYDLTAEEKLFKKIYFFVEPGNESYFERYDDLILEISEDFEVISCRLEDLPLQMEIVAFQVLEIIQAIENKKCSRSCKLWADQRSSC